MGWSIGYDGSWGRDVGYGVPATCDHPGCGTRVDRGLAYVCGGQPYGGEHGCGLFFCADHLMYTYDAKDEFADVPKRCERCVAGGDPFEPTPDVDEWVQHKLTDESWADWRAENADEVARLTAKEAAG